jgi:hypothetical protein
MDAKKQKTVIGRAERIKFPEIGIGTIHARIDTGAKTSSIWVSSAQEQDGMLEVVFLGDRHGAYQGKPHVFEQYERRMVASSNGAQELRYVVRLLAVLKGRRIRANFTLADRSTQVYPVLVGRNILHGKFIVDVKQGKPLRNLEIERSNKLQSSIEKKEN